MVCFANAFPLFSRKRTSVKPFFYLICGPFLVALAACGQDVTLTIDAPSGGGYEIPRDFAGVSIFTGTQVRDHENMLSRAWVTNNYPELYRSVLKPVQQEGFRFHLTELDDHVH